MKEQLNGEYREVFSVVLVYGTMKNVSTDVLTDRITELYDILLTAQTEGRDIKRIVGSDTERFCKDFYQDYTASDRIKLLPDRFYGFAWVIFVLEFLTLIVSDESTGKTVSNVAPYLFGIGIGVIFELLCRFFVMPLMFKNKKIKPTTWSTIAGLSFIVMFVGILLFEGYLKIELNVPVLPLVIGSGIYIAAYFTARSIWRYKRFGTIRDERKQMLQDNYYKELSNIQLETVVLKSWKKKYERLSKKNQTDPEDFMIKLKKNERMNDMVDKSLGLFVLAIFISAVIGTAGECEGLTDLLMFAFFMGIVEFAIWRFCSKSFKQGSAVRKKLIRECEVAGQTMPEYIEERLCGNE